MRRIQLYQLSAKRVARDLATLATILIIALLMPFCLLTTPAGAEGGIGMSGSFYRQQYELLPGETLFMPDVYVVVFNTSDKDMNLQMSTQSPAGVEIVLDAGKYTLAPHTDRKIGVTLNIGAEAVPGNYDLVITAAVVAEGKGIKVTTASQQRAKLTIFGSAGRIKIATFVPDGQPLPAIIRLFREEDGQQLPAGYSETGQFEKRVVPGDYMVQAYYKDIQVAEDNFSLAANEEKNINLTARILYMTGFDVVPYHNDSDGELSVGEIQYTLVNIYQPLKDVKAILQTRFEDTPLKEVSVLSLGTLDTGSISGSYNYVPDGGWKKGIYWFKIEVNAAGTIYDVMDEQQFKAEALTKTISEETVKSAKNDWGLSPRTLIEVGMVIGLGGAAYYILRRRKRSA